VRREVWLLWCASVLCMSACDREIDRPGQLIVTIDTDMALPDQVDQLHIRVEVEGRTKFEDSYDVGPRTAAAMPATLNLVSYSDTSESVTVKIAGSAATREGLSWRTYREATMQIPRDRIARLHMPIQWLCKGQAESANTNDSPLEKQRAKSTCDAGYACRAGRCEKAAIKESSLPDYTPEEVFGGGTTPDEGSCFDTLGCLAQGRTVPPDEDCRIPKPEAKRINVALRVLNDGICDTGGLNCYVPLDRDEKEGWRVAGDQLQLPPAVCDKMREGLVRAVLVADACEPKTSSVPTCGPWSRVPKGDAGEYRPSGMVKPSATLLTTLPSQTDADRCCPLMAAGDKLFACVCAGASSGTVFEIDPGEASNAKSVGTLNPSATRMEPLAASVFDGSLYWAAGREVRRTPLAGSSALATGFGVPAPAALYETGSLLTDQASIYALASGGSAASDSAVQLFAIPRDGSSGPVAVPMGNTPVFQFDQDDAAVYLALDQDVTTGAMISRTSSVVRIDKHTGLRSTLMPERTLMLPGRERGGYVGVLAEGDTVFALFEDVDASGMVRAQLKAAAVDAPAKSEPKLLYELPIDPARTRIRLLGVADEQVLLSQVELDGTSVASASVLMVPIAGGNPRVAADFVRDFPVDGFGVDADRIYWLNASGALYTLPRSVLR
jgi:hypothetical protein